MEKKVEMAGGLIGAICAAFADSWQFAVVAVVFYAICLFGNLITGLLYANQTNTYSEEKGRHAFYKKLGAITGIAVTLLLDFMAMGIGREAGIVYNLPLFTCVMAGYSAAHEFTSMITNIKLLGNHVPAAIENAAKKAEDALDQGKLPDLGSMTGQKKEGT